MKPIPKNRRGKNSFIVIKNTIKCMDAIIIVQNMKRIPTIKALQIIFLTLLSK